MGVGMKLLDASSVICILKEIEEPRIYHICKALGHELYVTKEVHEELEKNEITYTKFQEFGMIHILNVDYADEEIKQLKRKYPWMHDGEASMLCAGNLLLKANISFYCVIDERARKIAKRKNLPTTGTVGLILWEKEKGQLEKKDVQEMKRKLDASPFYLSQACLEALDYGN